jgi:hypothetical protein
MLHAASGRRVLLNTVTGFHKRPAISRLDDNKVICFIHKASLAKHTIFLASKPSGLGHEFTFTKPKYRYRRRSGGLFESLRGSINFLPNFGEDGESLVQGTYVQFSEMLSKVCNRNYKECDTLGRDRSEIRKVYQCEFEIPSVYKELLKVQMTLLLAAGDGSTKDNR